ncbi:MAG TPA: exodeoxyribonuclease VII small subunit [Haloplasmataceae bacterium]
MEQSFEKAMSELEEIVKKLESGEVNLEDSITLYKRGLELYGYCYQKLQEAEKLVVKINDERIGD